jgi:hypothetical protein
MSLPSWNRTTGGQESVVYIRIDERPSAPALTVEHVSEPAGQLRSASPGWLTGCRSCR